MKRITIILALLSSVLIGFIVGQRDAKAATVKPECPFEAGECPNPGCLQNTCREYQFDIAPEGTTIYEGNRRVGFLPFDSTQALDKLMLWDNQ